MADNNADGLAPATEVTFHSYRDYFAQSEHNPFNGDYTEVLAPYRIPLANQDVPTPATVQTLSLNCASQIIPTAFLLQHDDGLLHVYLQLAKFHRRMGLPAMQSDEHMVCQHGELYRNQAQLVTWNAAYFHPVNAAVHVPTRDTINTSYAGDNDAVFLGQFGDNDAGTKVIRICRTCYVPPRICWYVFGRANESTCNLGEGDKSHLHSRPTVVLHSLDQFC